MKFQGFHSSAPPRMLSGIIASITADVVLHQSLLPDRIAWLCARLIALQPSPFLKELSWSFALLSHFL